MGTRGPISESSRPQRRTRFNFSAFVLLTLAALSVMPAASQVLYGSLTGNVTDSSGAAIPNATVEALNTLRVRRALSKTRLYRARDRLCTPGLPR